MMDMSAWIAVFADMAGQVAPFVFVWMAGSVIVRSIFSAAFRGHLTLD